MVFTVQEKAKIVLLKSQGCSNASVAKQVGCNESSVRRFWIKYQETNDFRRAPGSGRKRKTSSRDDREIVAMAVKDRFLSSPEISTQFCESSGIQVSKWTVCRRLDEAGLRSRRPAKKPLLTQKMRNARLQWAKARSYWSKRHWGDVIFSDESKFNLIGPDGGARVRRRAGERYDSSCVQSTVKHSPYVMVWGAITKHGVGEIIILNGTVDSQAYKRIIDEGVIPTMEQLSEKRSRIIFQDDSAPCHRSKMVRCNNIFTLQNNQ